MVREEDAGGEGVGISHNPRLTQNRQMRAPPSSATTRVRQIRCGCELSEDGVGR